MDKREIMCEAEIELAGLRLRIKRLQDKVAKIEREHAFSSPERYEHFKPDVEFIFEALELSLETCQLMIERTLKLYDIEFIENYEYFVEQELQNEVKRFNSKVRKLNTALKKAVS